MYVLHLNELVRRGEWQNWIGNAAVTTSGFGKFNCFCKSTRIARRQCEKRLERLHSDDSAKCLKKYFGC